MGGYVQRDGHVCSLHKAQQFVAEGRTEEGGIAGGSWASGRPAEMGGWEGGSDAQKIWADDSDERAGDEMRRRGKVPPCLLAGRRVRAPEAPAASKARRASVHTTKTALVCWFSCRGQDISCLTAHSSSDAKKPLIRI